MSLKRYLILMSCMTLFCWLAWLVVLYFINPDEAGFVGFLLFYASLIVALVGTFSLFGFFLRVWFSKEEVIFRHLGVSTRQSIWFAILIVGSLLLLGVGYLRWWSELLLIMFLLLMEFFYLTGKSSRRV
jgi:hypothetical protein